MPGLLSAIRARPARPPVATLWGEGFAADGLGALAAVRDWDLCTPDEFVFPFPLLIAGDGVLPAVLLAHLEAAVAARRPSAARRAGPALSKTPEETARERMIDATLSAILLDARRGRRPARQEGSDAVLAFGAGLHPAYLWAETLLAPERGIAAGWLGHLDRGRPALMPPVVAEYVSDALGGDGGPVKDALLRELVGCKRRMDQVRQTARRRLRGLDPVLRFGPRRSAPRVPPLAAILHAAIARP